MARRRRSRETAGTSRSSWREKRRRRCWAGWREPIGLLCAALHKAIAEPWHLLADLEAAVEGLEPYLSNSLQDGHYPLRVLALNRPRPEPKKLAALRRTR